MLARLCATIPRARGFFLTRGETGGMARSVEALIDEIDLLTSRGLPRKEFFAEPAPGCSAGQRRELLAHARPATRLLTSDDPGGADRPRDLHPEHPRRRRAVHPQRVHDRRRQHVRRARRQASAGRDPQPRHRAIPRPARYRDLLLPSDIPHSSGRIRHPRARVGRCPHRPPRVERTVPTQGRRRPRRHHRRGRRGTARRCASTRPGASTGSSRPASSSSAPATRSR